MHGGQNLRGTGTGCFIGKDSAVPTRLSLINSVEVSFRFNSKTPKTCKHVKADHFLIVI